MSGITGECAGLVCEDKSLGMLQLFSSVSIAENNKGGEEHSAEMPSIYCDLSVLNFKMERDGEEKTIKKGMFEM